MSKTMLITGASRGIGRALSLHLASEGYDLALTARNSDDLEKIKAEINSEYPSVSVEIRELDVTDYLKVYDVIRELDSALNGIDIVFANAGIYLDGPAGKGNFEKYKTTIETDLIGAVATIDAAVEIFKERGKGHIAATSSVIALRGLPRSPSYAAAKAGLSFFLETVRAELHGSGIDVTVIFPGYIDTDLNNTLANRPFLISAEKGAEIITRLIEKKVKRSTVPVFPWNIIGRVLRILPDWIIAKM